MPCPLSNDYKWRWTCSERSWSSWAASTISTLSTGLSRKMSNTGIFYSKDVASVLSDYSYIVGKLPCEGEMLESVEKIQLSQSRSRSRQAKQSTRRPIPTWSKCCLSIIYYYYSYQATHSNLIKMSSFNKLLLRSCSRRDTHADLIIMSYLICALICTGCHLYTLVKFSKILLIFKFKNGANGFNSDTLQWNKSLPSKQKQFLDKKHRWTSNIRKSKIRHENEINFFKRIKYKSVEYLYLPNGTNKSIYQNGWYNSIWVM
jgi:hypothetical protein